MEILTIPAIIGLACWLFVVALDLREVRRELREVRRNLSDLYPLITKAEIRHMKEMLAEYDARQAEREAGAD